MILGLDMGGTHTDAVLLDDAGIVASAKVTTNHDDLLSSIYSAIEEVIDQSRVEKIERVNLSTTLSTNAIVERRTEATALIVSSGPGINPRTFAMGDHFYTIPGSIDHRGTVIDSLDEAALSNALEQCGKKGVRAYALVTKFSPRNAEQELFMAERAAGQAHVMTLGHRLSGRLSFPRRMATAYFNAAVWRTYNGFADAIEEGLNRLGITAPIHFLKADGGTMPLVMSREIPVESILSGPAASVMGIVGLCRIDTDSVILDMGGTTTDIAVFADGAPLIVRDGISIAGYPTLVRALNTRSIGIGGDSALQVVDGELTVGPERFGPAMALGGSVPTLVDALNVMGHEPFGDGNDSRQGMSGLARSLGCTVEEAAHRAAQVAVESIANAVASMLHEINEKPVYTIHEMLQGKVVSPETVYAVGGPVKKLYPLFKEYFSLPVIIPENYHVANAIGAALARTTFDVELFADTARGTLVIPNLDIRKTIDAGYTLEQAESDAVSSLCKYMEENGVTVDPADIEIIDSSLFRMSGGYLTRGNDIRVKCQIKPGGSWSYHGESL